MIGAEAEQLARIVDDILLAGALDAGPVELADASCDVAAVAADVVEAARTRVPDGLALRLAAPSAGVAAACDAAKLRQVLVNVVDNAIKYSPDGGTVEVTVAGRDGRAVVAVADEGIGVPPGDRERVFEKFVRLDPEQRGGVRGTGLGLYITRELVRRMDGTVGLLPNDGGGTTVVLELPAPAASHDG